MLNPISILEINELNFKLLNSENTLIYKKAQKLIKNVYIVLKNIQF